MAEAGPMVGTECDVSVSKLFHFLDSIRFSIKKISEFDIKNIWYKNKYRIRYQKKLSKSLEFVCLKHGFVKFGIDIGIGFKTFQFI